MILLEPADSQMKEGEQKLSMNSTAVCILVKKTNFYEHSYHDQLLPSLEPFSIQSRSTSAEAEIHKTTAVLLFLHGCEIHFLPSMRLCPLPAV